MICNKCGKNNLPDAVKCSACGEELPATANCGGFSDILTYTAPPQAEAAAQPVVEVVQAPPVITEREKRRLMELSKRAVIFGLAAIAISVLLAIITFVSNANLKDEIKELKTDIKKDMKTPEKEFDKKNKNPIVESPKSSELEEGDDDESSGRSENTQKIQEIIGQYEEILSELSENELPGYAVYDINNDGNPELLICTTDKYFVCTYGSDDMCEQGMRDSFGSFYKDKSGVGLWYSKKNDQYKRKVMKNNKMEPEEAEDDTRGEEIKLETDIAQLSKLVRDAMREN